MQGLKSAILAIFQTAGQDGRALLVWPSRIPHRISKILFPLGADELRFNLVKNLVFYQLALQIRNFEGDLKKGGVQYHQLTPTNYILKFVFHFY